MKEINDYPVCKTCDNPVNHPTAKTCDSCHEIESKLEAYAKTGKKARTFISDVLAISGKRSKKKNYSKRKIPLYYYCAGCQCTTEFICDSRDTSCECKECGQFTEIPLYILKDCGYKIG